MAEKMKTATAPGNKDCLNLYETPVGAELQLVKLYVIEL